VIEGYAFTEEEIKTGSIPHETWVWKKEVPVPTLGGDPTAVLSVSASVWRLSGAIWRTNLSTNFYHRGPKKKYIEAVDFIPTNVQVVPPEIQKEAVDAVRLAIKWLANAVEGLEP
jgi:hypothetical protein